MNPTPTGRVVTVITKPGITLNSPDTSTIEIVAAAIGAKGTQVNIKGTFTTNGDTPAFQEGDPVSNYILGDTQAFQVVPARLISTNGSPARPYTLKLLVEADNVADSQDKVTAKLNILFPVSPDHIKSLSPSMVAQTTKSLLKVTAGPTVTQDGSRKVTTVTYVNNLIVNDPFGFQILTRVEGPPGSLGVGRIHVVTSLEPAAPPTLPAYDDPFDGDISVGEEIEVYPVINARTFRGASATRKLYAKVRAIDYDNANIVCVAIMELNIVAGNTLNVLAVLVRVGTEIHTLETLPVVAGAFEIEAGDSDTVEVLLSPTGAVGSQAIVRGTFMPYATGTPSLPAITDVASFDENGISFSSDEGVLGIYSMDRKAPFVPSETAGDFRNRYTSTIRCLVDGTSTLNLSNTLQKSFALRFAVPTPLTGVSWKYMNSRNPDQFLPIQAGTDINGTITGSGTYDDPFVIPVDSPEQLQCFVVPVQKTDVDLSWVQTTYAVGENLLDVLYPSTPEGWHRAFTSTQRVLALPNPTAPGTLGLRPPRGDELILMSGGTAVGDPGVNPGYSGKFHLYARAQAVRNVDNVVESHLYFKVVDPDVL